MSFISRTARRYAQALYSLADEREATEAVLNDLKAVEQIFRDHPTLPEFLGHERVPAARKTELYRQFFRPKPTEAAAADSPELDPNAMAEAPPPGLDIESLTWDFLRLLVEHHRIGQFAQVTQAYQELWDQAHGIVRATVTVPVRLLKEEQDSIEAKLREITGARHVELTVRQSKGIIGGIVIRVGDHVIDASVRTYLNALRDRLKRVRVRDLESAGLVDINLDALREQGLADLAEAAPATNGAPAGGG